MGGGVVEGLRQALRKSGMVSHVPFITIITITMVMAMITEYIGTYHTEIPYYHRVTVTPLRVLYTVFLLHTPQLVSLEMPASQRQHRLPSSCSLHEILPHAHHRTESVRSQPGSTWNWRSIMTPNSNRTAFHGTRIAGRLRIDHSKLPVSPYHS